MGGFVSLAEILRRSYIKQEGIIYAPTPLDIKNIENRDKSKKLLIESELARDNYIDFIINYLGYSSDGIEEMFPGVLNISEELYWKHQMWGGWNTTKGKAILYSFELFLAEYEALLKRENYLDENESLVTILNTIVTKLNSISDSRKLNNSGLDSLYLVIYILFRMNLEDIFGNYFVTYMFEDMLLHSLTYNRYNLVANSTFMIEDSIYSRIMHDLSDPDLYMLNLVEYSTMTNKDKILQEIDEFIEDIENSLKVDVNILVDNNARIEIINGYIIKMLTQKSDLEKTTRNKSSLPLKTLFKTVKNHIRLGQKDSGERERDEALIDAVMTELEKEDPKEKKSYVRDVVKEVIISWWTIYRENLGLSIQEALKKIKYFDSQLKEKGMYIEYEFTCPYNIRLVVYNSRDLDFELEELQDNLTFAEYLLIDPHQKLKPTERLTGLKRVVENDSLINLHGSENFTFRAFDLYVYSWEIGRAHV